MNKKTLLGGLAAGLFAVSGVTFAQSVTFGTPTPAQGPAGTVFDVAVNFTAGGGAAAYQVDVAIPAEFTNVTPTNATGVCAVGNPQAGAMRVSDFDAGLQPLASGEICTIQVTIAAATPDGTYNFSTCASGACLTPRASDGGGANIGAFSVDYGPGFIVGAAPADPPTINFNPTTVNLPAGGAIGATSGSSPIAVTATGGTAPDAGSYDCTVPANFQVTNSSNPSIVAGTDPNDMSVTCTLAAAAQQATMTCTRTGAVATPVDIELNCPAGQVVAPAFTTTPPNGTALTCNGTPGSTATTQVTIQNSGNAAATGVTCSTAGAGFSIQQQPSGTINAGASSVVVASCSVPANGVTINGTLNCTSGNGAGPVSFPLSSTGSAIVAPTQAATIPSTSLWAKIGLIGLLAALGALVVGFRRHS